ncbi:MAG: hypothetical protein WCF62_26040 [Pseudolabrys sp.]
MTAQAQQETNEQMGKNSVGHWPLAGIQLHQSMLLHDFLQDTKGRGADNRIDPGDEQSHQVI